MQVSTKSDFLKKLREAELVSEERIATHLEQHDFDDPRQLALSMARADLITNWQAKFLLSGRSRLKIGNYVLLDRIARDELGDQFLAWHEPLHRKVDLQVLSESLTPQSPNYSSFRETTSQLTRLDHPGLVHVYDVGQERGRYFVVWEHVSGQTLQSHFGQLDGAHALAGVLRDVSDALRYLHSNGLAHGELNEAAVVVDENGQGKIVRLATAVLRKQVFGLGPERAVAEGINADRAAWARIAVGVIDRLLANATPSSPNESTKAQQSEFQTWREMAGKIAFDPESITRLHRLITNWLAGNDRSVESAVADLLVDTSTNLPSDAIAAADLGDKPTLPPAGRVRAVQKPTPTASPKPALATVAMSPWISVRRWYVGAMFLVVVCGFAIYLGSRFFAGGSRGSWQVSGSNNPTETRAGQDGNAGSLAKKSFAKRGSSNRSQSKTDHDEVTEIERDSPRIESLGSKQDESTTLVENVETENETAATTTIDTSSTTPSPSGAALNSSTKAPQDKDADVKPSKAKSDPFVIPGRDDSSTKDKAAGGQQVNDSMPPVSAQTGIPFSSVPPQLAISPASDKSLQRLGAINVADPAALDLNLIYDPESIAKSRLFIEIQRDAKQSNRWRVGTKRRAEETESELAGFFVVEEGDLKFQWDEKIDEKSIAGSLINGCLRMTALGQTATRCLRVPTEFEGLALDPKTLSAELSLELPSIPRSESITFEFGPFEKETIWEGTRVENPLFDSRLPAVLLFNESDSEQAFGLAISRDFKNKLEVSAQWVAIANDRLTPLKAKDFEAIIAGLGANYAHLIARTEQAQIEAENAPYGQKTATRDRAKQIREEMEAAKANNDLANFYVDKLKSILAQELPLRIVYKFEGNTIELARTRKAADK